jgi:hypothetical protein
MFPGTIILTFLILATFAALTGALIYWIGKKPTGQGNWSLDQDTLPWADIFVVSERNTHNDLEKKLDKKNFSDSKISQNKKIILHKIRNFIYRSVDDYTPQYYDKDFLLDDVQTMDFMVEPYKGTKGAAHTLFTFGLKDGSHIAISVEVRKQKGEKFSVMRGLPKHFELMYVVADERDVIGLRANHRRDPVYLYPLIIPPEKIREIFLEMLQRVNSLYIQPEYYNIFTNSCIVNLIKHINSVLSGCIPWTFNIFTPEYIARLFYDIGLIDNSKPFEQIQASHHINTRAYAAKDDSQFSLRIRF